MLVLGLRVAEAHVPGERETGLPRAREGEMMKCEHQWTRVGRTESRWRLPEVADWCRICGSLRSKAMGLRWSYRTPQRVWEGEG